MNARGPNAFPKEKIRFIEPMYARLVNELPAENVAFILMF
jgi:hypothetical protein